MGAASSTVKVAPGEPMTKSTSSPHPIGPAIPQESVLQSRFSGLQQLLQQPGCRDAFSRFLCAEKFATDALANAMKGITDSSLTSAMEAFVQEMIESLRLVTLEDIRFRSSLGAMLCNPSLKPAIVLSVLLKLYPRFLKSSHYQRAKEAGSVQDQQALALKRKALSSLTSYNPLELKIAQRAIATVDLAEVDRLIQSGSWLTSMLAAVENLPVCVSLSTASKDRPGFPLIYVNVAFEKTTGYSRNEIVGQNCRFLQAGKAEQESIDRLTAALREAKPVRVAITNFRKDGMPFKNLLAMKPIFSESGSYEYVVGVQFDVTQDDATPEKLKLADQVIQMLPNVIVTKPLEPEAK